MDTPLNRIGGTLDWRDLADPRRVHFARMTREQQAKAIHRMADEGHHHDTIARATGLSAEAVRRVLGELHAVAEREAAR